MRSEFKRLVVVVATGSLFVAVCWLVSSRGETAIDRAGFELIALSSTDRYSAVATFAVGAGELVLAVVTVGFILALVWRGAARDSLVIVFGLLLCYLGAHIVKVAVGRPRPSGELIHAGGFSFPSTTSALSVCFIAIAIALTRLNLARPRDSLTIGLGCLLTGVIGLIFVVLRVHYVTDVIAGWSFGVVVFAVCDLALPRGGFLAKQSKQVERPARRPPTATTKPGT
jgi:membrane-associated phospholipid phosphatase